VQYEALFRFGRTTAFSLVNCEYDTAFNVGIYVNRRMLHCNKSAQSRFKEQRPLAPMGNNHC